MEDLQSLRNQVDRKGEGLQKLRTLSRESMTHKGIGQAAKKAQEKEVFAEPHAELTAEVRGQVESFTVDNVLNGQTWDKVQYIT